MLPAAVLTATLTPYSVGLEWLKVRFDLVDRVVERSADRLVSVKAVTAAEEYLGDHFPGFPILPGVMMLECLIQAGRELVAGEPGCPAFGGDRPLVLEDVRNVRYGNMVKPGQSLHVEVQLRKHDGDAFELQGTGKVEGQVAVQGRFRLAPMPQ